MLESREGIVAGESHCILERHSGKVVPFFLKKLLFIFEREGERESVQEEAETENPEADSPLCRSPI